MPNLIRHHLINGNARVNVRARRLLHAHAGQERAAGSRVIARAVRAGRGVDVIQSAEDLQLMLHLRQRLHGARELKIFSRAARPPVLLNCTVRKIDEGHPQRRTARRGGEFAQGFRLRRQRGKRSHRFKRRQRETRAEAAQEMAAVEAGETFSGKVPVYFHGVDAVCALGSDDGTAAEVEEMLRRFWNGADSMTPWSSAENFPFSFSSCATMRSSVSTS